MYDIKAAMNAISSVTKDPVKDYNGSTFFLVHPNNQKAFVTVRQPDEKTEIDINLLERQHTSNCLLMQYIDTTMPFVKLDIFSSAVNKSDRAEFEDQLMSAHKLHVALSKEGYRLWECSVQFMADAVLVKNLYVEPNGTDQCHGLSVTTLVTTRSLSVIAKTYEDPELFWALTWDEENNIPKAAYRLNARLGVNDVTITASIVKGNINKRCIVVNRPMGVDQLFGIYTAIKHTVSSEYGVRVINNYRVLGYGDEVMDINYVVHDC